MVFRAGQVIFVISADINRARRFLSQRMGIEKASAPASNGTGSVECGALRGPKWRGAVAETKEVIVGQEMLADSVLKATGKGAL
jgi:hypothetical protein